MSNPLETTDAGLWGGTSRVERGRDCHFDVFLQRLEGTVEQ
jgi:hypothetical protein